jgi:hypothetical protein
MIRQKSVLSLFLGKLRASQGQTASGHAQCGGRQLMGIEKFPKTNT